MPNTVLGTYMVGALYASAGSCPKMNSPSTVLAYAKLKRTSPGCQPVAPVSEGRSGPNTVEEGGEKPESRGTEAVRKKRTTQEGECSLTNTTHATQLLLPLAALLG